MVHDSVSIVKLLTKMAAHPYVPLRPVVHSVKEQVDVCQHGKHGDNLDDLIRKFQTNIETDKRRIGILMRCSRVSIFRSIFDTVS